MLPTGTTEKVRCPQCELLQTALCRRCQAKLKLAPHEAAAQKLTFLQAEKALILRTLDDHAVGAAAKILGVSRWTLARKMIAHRIPYGAVPHKVTPKITRFSVSRCP